MKFKIISSVILLVVLSILFVLTSGNTDESVQEPLQTQPQSNFNF